jgi:Holliday junction resolvase RusA-like endonuclease
MYRLWLAFTVNKRAAPRGSKRPVKIKGGRTILIDSSKKSVPFMDSVRADCLEAARNRRLIPEEGNFSPWSGPVLIEIIYTYKRPKKHFSESKRFGRTLRGDAPPVPCSGGVPDVDKTHRAVQDGLSGVAFGDDAQVNEIRDRREWGSAERTAIRIFYGPRTMDEAAEWRTQSLLARAAP